MHLIGDGCQHPAQEVGGQHFGRSGLQLGEGQLAGAVNGYEEVLAAFFGVDFGKIHVQIANGIVLEFLLLFRRFRAGQPADAVALKQAVQG
jgi:hypothetical protein